MEPGKWGHREGERVTIHYDGPISRRGLHWYGLTSDGHQARAWTIRGLHTALKQETRRIRAARRHVAERDRAEARIVPGLTPATTTDAAATAPEAIEWSALGIRASTASRSPVHLPVHQPRLFT
jgi:hypothetical protein